MIKAKSILKRTLAVVLALLTLLSTGIVSALAATVELAPTGKSYTANEYLYVENFNPSGWGSPWIQSSGTYWAHLYNNSTNDYVDITFEHYSGTKNASGAIYRALVPKSGTFDRIIFLRSANAAGNWSVWNRSPKITISDNSNYFKDWSVTTDENATGSCTQSYYAAAPTSATISITSSNGGTGSQADPYIVPYGTSFNLKVSCTHSDPGMDGFKYGINTTTLTTATAGLTSVTKTISSSSSDYPSENEVKSYKATVASYVSNTSGTIKATSSNVESDTIYIKAIPTTCKVTVNEENTRPEGASITIDNVSATTKDVDKNSSPVVSITIPNGYTATVSGDVTTETLSAGTKEYTFSNIDTNKTINITYDQLSYTVTVNKNFSDGADVTISKSAPNYGDEITITATVKDGYVFNGWANLTGGTYAGGTSGNVSTIKVNVTDNVTIDLNLTALDDYTIDVTYDAGGTAHASKSPVYEGQTVTLTATPNTGYHFTGWEITSGSYTPTDVDLKNNPLTITPTGDITAKATFAPNTGTMVLATSEGGTVTNAGSHPLTYDTYVTSTATANASHNFVSWNVTGIEGEDYEFVDGTTETDPEIKIRIIKDNVEVTATATFAIKELTVTFKNGVTDATISTATVNYGGTVTAPTAPVIEGYSFSRWDTSLTNITADTTITAIYLPKTFVINLTKTVEGGTATSSVSSVTFPNTVTLIATPTGDYIFTNWEIEGAYETVSGTENSAEFVIKPKANLTITPVFAEGQKLTVHSYSVNDYNKLTLTEGSATLIDGVTQPNTNTFNGIEWLSSDKVELTGDSTDVTALLAGEGGSGVPDGTGNLVMFDTVNLSGWSKVYLYTNITYTSTNGATGMKTGYQMSNIAGTTYWYTYVPSDVSLSKILFVNDNVNNYNDLSGKKASYVTNAESNYSTKPVFTPNNSYVSAHNSEYYNTGSWSAYTAPKTDTGNIPLTEYLYNGSTWLGNTEVWIYDGAEGVVVTTRAQLLKLIEKVNRAYNGGVNTGYTEDTWEAFVSAYTNAYDISGAYASKQADIDSALSALQTAYDNLVYDKTSNVTVIQNIAGGTVTIQDQTTTDLESTLEIPQNYAQTISVVAPKGYYVQYVTVNNSLIHQSAKETDVTVNNSCSFTQDTGAVVVTYAPRTEYTITFKPYENNGTITYNGSGLIDYAEGGTVKVYNGDNFTFYANPITDYEVKSWIVDGKSRGANDHLVLTGVSKNMTVEVVWGEIEYYNVAIQASPNSVADVSATANGTTVKNIKDQNSIRISKYMEIELKVDNIKNATYEFAGWTISGKHSIIAGSGTLSTQTVKIRANEDLTITANFTRKTEKVIYLKNEAGWDSVNIHYWGGSNDTSWPGITMTYDSSICYWVATIPEGTPNLKFCNTNSTNTQTNNFEGIGDNNTFTNKNTTGDILAITLEDGYYLAGWWNNQNYTNHSNIKMEEDINGIYSVKILIDEFGTASGYTDPLKYFFAYVMEDDGSVWKSTTPWNDTNGQLLVKGAANDPYMHYPNDELRPYYVTFTFNKDTGAFTWSFENAPEIVKVYANDGQTKTNADGDMTSNNGRVGDTYFGSDNVFKTETHTYYNLGDVEKNKPVTIYTQVNGNGAGGYDYYVHGWVVNGNQYVNADPHTNGLYSGTFVFTEEENTVTPVYFHTQEWLTAKEVPTVTVYAVNSYDNITNWDEYMSIYTWFDGDDKEYRQFGDYTGQLMIPVTGVDGLYYTIVETKNPWGSSISGVTFSNHGDASNGYNVSGDVLDYGNSGADDHIQTYDYYEFVSLNEDNKENITFVLKNTNDHYNKDDLQAPTSDAIKDKYNFVPYVDYSGLKTDIFGTNIEDNYSNLSESEALYVIQTGNHDTTKDDSTILNGQWFVKAYFYKADGTYIGECWSYELHKSGTPILTTLSSYSGKKVYISYETVNDGRYDGEWYGDADLNVTVNLAVNVALKDEDGNITLAGEADNVADYGTAYISGDKQNDDKKRNETAVIIATPKSGYKFVGWYDKSGKFFATSPEKEVIAGVGTYYTAVFEKLDDGMFTVNHLKYTASGATANYYPQVHGGNALLYVGVENLTTGASDSYKQANAAYVEAEENDILRITIGTDPTGAHKFFAWFVEAMDKYGFISYEEVGVDTEENLAFSDPDSDYYMNVNTVEGSNEIVYFQFIYKVKNNDDFNITIYSDVENVTPERTITYYYTDRFDNTREYAVKVKLTDDEVTGFAGNDYKAFTPAYISGDTWVNTVLANAPFVGDYFKNITWNVTEFKTNGLTIWGTEDPKTYQVIFRDGENTQVIYADYNDLATYEAEEGRGFWFNDKNANGIYDEDVDLLLSYTNRYSLRVTESMTVIYNRTTEAFDFAVTIDTPVYGRVQETDDDGTNKSDKVQADYFVNILTPYLYGYSDFEPWYNGEKVNENWNGSQVTVESLTKKGYKVEYGIILEQVASIAIEDKDTYEEAEIAYGEALKKAQDRGYGVKTDETIILEGIKDPKNKIQVVNGYNHAFYQYDFTSIYKLTNMNRYQYYFEVDNTDSYWKRFYNVYAYVTITTPGETTSTTYISNVETLNIYLEGHRDPSSTSSFGEV